MSGAFGVRRFSPLSHGSLSTDFGILGAWSAPHDGLWLAFIGFVVYVRVASRQPRTADRIRDMIKGRPTES